MRRAISALSVAGLVVAGLLFAGPANGDTRICDPYGSTRIQDGRYIVQNNVWGASTPQCINVTGTGFSIESAEHNNTGGAPASYPSIFVGCHYDNCSAGSNLPMRVGDITSATSSISYSYSGGTYNASYDIWLDETARTTGQNGTEIMIWFDRQGPVHPIGSVVGTTEIGGRTWEVWQGNVGWNVVSYVAPAAITSWDFSVLDFINDVQGRGVINDDWYLTSIQAGFEPWIGGTGLSVDSFSAGVESGGDPPPTTASPTTVSPTTVTPTTVSPTTVTPTTVSPTTVPPTTVSPTTVPPTTTPPTTTPPTTGPTPDPTSSCEVAYVPHTWNSGFVAYVTITNTGSTAVDGWTLAFDLAEGHSASADVWGATLATDGSAVTARNVDWNAQIAPGASIQMGFVGTHGGEHSSPTSFILNGTICSG